MLNINERIIVAKNLIARRIEELETKASNYDAVIGQSQIHKEAALRADFLNKLKTMAITPTASTNIDIIVGALRFYEISFASGMLESRYRATLRSIKNAIDPRKTDKEEKKTELQKIFEYCNDPSSFKHLHLQALLAATSDLIVAAQATSTDKEPEYFSLALHPSKERAWDARIEKWYDKTVFVRDTITSLLDAITPPEPKTEHAAGGEGGKGAGAGAAGGGGGVGVAKTEPAAETGSMAGAGGGGGGVGAAASQSTLLSTTPFQTQTGAGTTPIKERTSDL